MLSHGSMQFAFCCVVYPCLVLQYMGQAAFLSKNFSALPSSFYSSIPGKHLVNLHFMSFSSTPYNLYESLQFWITPQQVRKVLQFPKYMYLSWSILSMVHV